MRRQALETLVSSWPVATVWGRRRFTFLLDDGVSHQRCPSPKLRPAGKRLIFQVGPGDNLSSMVTIPLHMLRLVPFLCGGPCQLASLRESTGFEPVFRP